MGGSLGAKSINDKIVAAGNPVRKDFFRIDRNFERDKLKIEKDEKMVLIMGGSLGAKSINEVSISEPTAQEQKEMNPLMMIRGYEKTHRVAFDETTNDPTVWYLFLYPTVSKKVDYFRIRLSIDKNTSQLKKIEFSQRNADKLIFTIQKQQPIKDVAIFTFDKSRYPKVELNDLR